MYPFGWFGTSFPTFKSVNIYLDVSNHYSTKENGEENYCGPMNIRKDKQRDGRKWFRSYQIVNEQELTT